MAQVWFSETMYTPYSQMALIDAEPVGTWGVLAAGWVKGAPSVVREHGLAIATKQDLELSVQVTLGACDIDGDLVAEADLSLGNQGLEVSNASVDYPLQFPPGPVHVRAYLVGPDPIRTGVVFCLSSPDVSAHEKKQDV